MNPLIGITLDYEEPKGTPGDYSRLPWYAVRENYCSSLSQFGAVPLVLPHEVECVSRYLDLLQGLVITGGAFDVPPELYGDSSRHATVTTKDKRTQFEFAITRGAIERGMPILGICGGQQLLHVVLGGTLVQHIPDSIVNALEHEQKNPRTEPGHFVTVAPDTLLHRLVGDGPIQVNSAHHQAAGKVPAGVVVSGLAPDGVIEAIELPNHPFCLGVQWHPEYEVTPADTHILRAFVDACGDYGS